MASTMIGRAADLGMKPAAPSASARLTVGGSSLAETTATGTAGWSARMRLRPAMPSLSDSFRSSSSRSVGASARAA
ncbi:hypothetical protein D3C85_1718420 [compost metagenome]